MGPFIYCNKYTHRTIIMDIFKNNLCVNRYMQCCHNSNNDKLALLNTIYNQILAFCTSDIYTIYFKVFLMSILMSFDIELQ